jgi:hypothetical protein
MSWSSTNDEWLKELKVGDEVAVWHSSFGSGHYDFAKIEKIHKTHFVIGSTKYRRDSGRHAGESWHPAWLRQATPELRQEIVAARRLNFLCSKLAETNWRKLPTETLEAIYNILNPKE